MKTNIKQTKIIKKNSKALDLKNPDVYEKCVVDFADFYSTSMLDIDKMQEKYNSDFDDYDDESDNHDVSKEWMILDILSRFYQEYVKDLGFYDVLDNMIDASINKIKDQKLDKSLIKKLENFKKKHAENKNKLFKKYGLSGRGLVLS